MKQVRKILIVIIVIIFIFFLNSKLCLVPMITVEKARLDNPKICSTYLAYENNLIAFGGYNKKGTDNKVKLYDLDNKKINTIYQSNFNNSYNNFAAIVKNNKDENILINIQPIQFDRKSKYGIETYNFKTKELKTINLPIKKRSKNDNIRYSMDENNIYILDDTKETEIIGYKNKFSYKKYQDDFSNYGITNGIVLGGFKDGILQNRTSLKIMPENIPLDLIKPVENPELYRLEHSFLNDNFYAMFAVIDKMSANKFIQVLSWYDDSNVELLKTPFILKNANYMEAINLDENNILIFYEKNNNIYIAILSNAGINLTLDMMGGLKTDYKKQKFIKINETIYQIGGIKTKKPFKCADKIGDDMEISDLINWL